MPDFATSNWVLQESLAVLRNWVELQPIMFPPDPNYVAPPVQPHGPRWWRFDENGVIENDEDDYA